jgi:hypothetical protein
VNDLRTASEDGPACTCGEFGGLGIEVTMEEGLVKVVTSIRRHSRMLGKINSAAARTSSAAGTS